jgi:hypothetical protein
LAVAKTREFLLTHFAFEALFCLILGNDGLIIANLDIGSAVKSSGR